MSDVIQGAKLATEQVPLNLDIEKFRLEEYKSLWQIKNLLSTERRRIETFSIVGIVAIYGWILAHPLPTEDGEVRIMLILPVLLSILGLVRWIGVQSHMQKLVTYSRNFERRIFSSEGSWETFIEETRAKRPMYGYMETISEFTVWAALVLISVSIFLFWFKYIPWNWLGG